MGNNLCAFIHIISGEATEIRIPVPYGHIAGKVIISQHLLSNLLQLLLFRPGEIPLANPFWVSMAGSTMQGPMTTWPPSSMRWHVIWWEIVTSNHVTPGILPCQLGPARPWPLQQIPRGDAVQDVRWICISQVTQFHIPLLWNTPNILSCRLSNKSNYPLPVKV